MKFDSVRNVSVDEGFYFSLATIDTKRAQKIPCKSCINYDVLDGVCKLSNYKMSPDETCSDGRLSKKKRKVQRVIKYSAKIVRDNKSRIDFAKTNDSILRALGYMIERLGSRSREADRGIVNIQIIEAPTIDTKEEERINIMLTLEVEENK